jgi:hypothetical protein
MKAKSSHHFASPKTCDAQGSAVEILDRKLCYGNVVAVWLESAHW